MFGMHPFTSTRLGVKYLMENGQANSRFIYLIHGITTAVCCFVLTMKFTLAAPGNRVDYVEMFAVVSGTGVIPGAVGRMLAAKAAAAPSDVVPTTNVTNSTVLVDNTAPEPVTLGHSS